MSENSSRKTWAIGLAAGAALAAGALLAPAAASAHVVVEPDGAPTPGANLDLTFGIGHACDGSPTTAVRIEYPTDGIAGPKPVAQAGWSIEVEKDGKAGQPSAVVFTPDEPIGDDVRAEVTINASLLEDATGSLAFPVEQTCEDGSISWSEVASDGQDPHDLDSPAPVLEIARAGQVDDAEDSAAEPQGQAVPILLGTGGLVLGAAALVVSLTRRRG